VVSNLPGLGVGFALATGTALPHGTTGGGQCPAWLAGEVRGTARAESSSHRIDGASLSQPKHGKREGARGGSGGPRLTRHSLGVQCPVGRTLRRAVLCLGVVGLFAPCLSIREKLVDCFLLVTNRMSR